MTTHAATAEGHAPDGRFTKGNKCSRGRKVTELRRALIEAVTPEDIRQIVNAVKEKAKAGDLAAITLLFDRCIGRPMTAYEYELFTHEYDRADFEKDPMTINLYAENDQIRPLHFKG